VNPARPTETVVPTKRGKMRAAMSGLAMLCAWLVSSVAVISLIAWALGRLLTDRFAWSQWLWWIPTPAVLLLMVVGVLVASRPSTVAGRRRRRVLCWAIALVLVAFYFGFIEHRFMRRTPPIVASGVLQLTHWNVGPATWHDMQPSASAIVAIHGDVTLVTDHGGMLGDARLTALAADGVIPTIGRFGVITKLPILTMRILVATQGRWVALVELDATTTLGRPISIMLVDLPSSLKLPRMAMARELRTMLDSQRDLPKPDVLVGDFNIPRGSASLEVIIPGLRDAFTEAGHGYGATFHREFPLYHLDQMRLGDGVRALRYDLIDPGLGRHRAQRAWLTNSSG
jgi:hypothetical protein